MKIYFCIVIGEFIIIIFIYIYGNNDVIHQERLGLTIHLYTIIKYIVQSKHDILT